MTHHIIAMLVAHPQASETSEKAKLAECIASAFSAHRPALPALTHARPKTWSPTLPHVSARIWTAPTSVLPPALS